MIPPLTFRAYRSDYNQRINVYLVADRHDGGMAGEVTTVSAGRMEFTQLTPEQEGELHEPLLALNAMQAQSLMNALWGEGLRPSGRPDPAPQIDAMAAHLADMRTIAFKKLGIKAA